MQWLSDYLISSPIPVSGVWGVISLLCFLSLATAIGLPRQIAAFTCGYFFGLINGAVIATFAATLGCYTTYLIAHSRLSTFVFKKFPNKTAKIQQFLTTDLFLKAIIIRLLPLGSNFITNIVAGATRIPAIPFVSGSFIGYIPQMIIFSLAGSGIELLVEQRNYISLSLTIVALLLVAVCYYHHKQKFNA
ncbi:MAG: TVP38/TMEM64 family protein [Pseudoalteromonas spongiae]